MLNRFSDFNRTFVTLDELRRRMDWLFDEQEAAPRAQLRAEFDPSGRVVAGPRMHLFDLGKALLVKADLPGFTEKDLQISLNQDVLTLSGERKTEPREGYTVHRKERQSTRFSRSFTLPSKVDPEKTSATIKNGVLTLTLNKATEAQPRQISVSAS